jgi:DNA-directed RNA polymerase subunit omega
MSHGQQGVKRMTTQSAFHNKYSLVKGVARRARQLQSGAPPVGDSKSMKPCRVAQDEIRAGVVTYVVQHPSAAPITDPQG